MICKLDKNIKNYSCGYHLPDIKEIYLLNYSDFNGYDVDNCEYCVNWKEGSKWYKIDVNDDTTFADTLTIGNAGNKYRNIRLTFSIANNGDACVEEAYNAIVLGKYIVMFKSDGVFYVSGLLDGMSANESESNNETHTITLEENTILTTQIMSAECGQDVIDSANGEEPEPVVSTMLTMTFNNGGLTRTVEIPCDEDGSITTDTIAPYEQYGDLVGVEFGQCARSTGMSLFYKKSDLATLVINDGLVTIGNGSFYGIGIASINIPNSVTTISASAFKECEQLSEVSIGNGVTTIGNYAFDNCQNLSTVTVGAETPPTLGTDALGGTNVCPIYVPAASVEAYKTASGWSAYADRIQAIQ